MGRVKICGITNIEDAVAAAEYGADAIGFVFQPKSPRAITPETAKNIVFALPPFITTVGIFVNESKREIEKIARYVGLNIVQLHGNEPPDACQLSRKVIKAIRVKDLTDLEPLKGYNVSAFLLDTYSPHTMGGTGQIFNWDIAVEAKKFGRIILAGGLNHENIEEAIKWVRPYGIDVATGVEGNKKGEKDHKKLKLFIEKAREAFTVYA
ncbi:MAG: N-(5'-phosphoribosyl)anthranilate isomerase [Candidatus Schekmanbacteria bacterium RBG_16_38_10]|uniref:N-(5'-phosphoribosyl)anthranilate isomerase n=1 Tax=Candidatus Schekmanbacteria bacterium RBG_16_38_10 TaxID=1817879 RepID=A0A1F7RMA6_9BACT|nr:MAG: N-(5'-phosphoribosyl)anthranilate isomerase [Candidatus Schekmanbacteria bacterium RBG_16_38_10]